MDRWMDGEIHRSTDTQIRKNSRNRKNRTLGQIGRLVARIDGQIDTEIYWNESKEQKKQNKQIDKSQTSRNATYNFPSAYRLAATLFAHLMHVHLLRYSLFLCTCRQTCCNVTGSPLARGQWLAAAPLAFLMHVHTELLLRYLLVLRMAGRRAFYATCSSYA